MFEKNASRHTQPNACQTQIKRRTTLSLQASSRRSESNLDLRNNALVNARRSWKKSSGKIAPRRTQMSASQSQLERKTSVGLAYNSRRKSNLDHINNATVKRCSWKMPSEKNAPRRTQRNASQSHLERGTTTDLACSIRSKSNLDRTNNAAVQFHCFWKIPPGKVAHSCTQLNERQSQLERRGIMDREGSHLGVAFTRQSEHQVECKTAKTSALIVILFILLVYPRIIVIIYSLSVATRIKSANHARLWMRILLYCYSAVNPFLYSLRHREIWREFLKLVSCCCGERRRARERDNMNVTTSR